MASHILEQTIHNSLLNSFHSSELVLGHGHCQGQGFLLSLSPSLADPSLLHPSTRSPPPHVQPSFFYEVERLISASTLTSNLVYVNGIIRLRRQRPLLMKNSNLLALGLHLEQNMNWETPPRMLVKNGNPWTYPRRTEAAFL